MKPSELVRQSLADPTAFWSAAAELIEWERRPEKVIDDAEGRAVVSWFSDGRLNTSINALDRHVAAGRADQPAVIYDSPMVQRQESITYGDLLDRVSRFAGALSALGVEKGDRVVIYMPMIPEAIVSMLACARLGAIHSVVFGGFGPSELAARIDHAKPKVILAASCGFEPQREVDYLDLMLRALDRAKHAPQSSIVVQRPEGANTGAELPNQFDWQELFERSKPAPPVILAADDPLYILYTSGTTGDPKGVVRDNGGHAVALAWTMDCVYDTHGGDVFFAASDIGWVVGHSYCVYAPLIAGATTILYEGKPVATPDAGSFWRVIEQHKVNTLFAAPTAFRAIRREDPKAKLAARHNLHALRSVFVAGERLDLDTSDWLSEHLSVPIIDHWWQTETGWPISATCVGLGDQPRSGTVGRPVPGYSVSIADADGHSLPPGEEGAILIERPLPPGALLTLWQDEERFASSYFDTRSGDYHTGDSGILDSDGYLTVTGRADDVLSVAGHRISPGAIEQALNGHPAVAESAAIGVPDKIKGEVPVVLVVATADADMNTRSSELSARVRNEVGPIATPAKVLVVARLPKTRSGKILRRTIRDIAAGLEPKIPATIEDSTVVDEIKRAFAS